MSMEIPSSEKKKLYPFLSDSLLPIIFVSFVVLGTLFFGEQNVVIFYVVPWLVQISFYSKFTPEIFLRTLGLKFDTTRQKLISYLSIPVGYGIGYALVKWATSGLTFFKVSTFPWVQNTLSSVGGIGTLASYTSGENLLLYTTVAFFEETLAISFGKTISNYIYKKFGGNRVGVSILGYFLGRIVLTSHHWFSYGGTSNPQLYLSALFMFTIFTLVGILFGLLIHNFKLGDSFDDLGFLPITVLPMFFMHLAFDYTMSLLVVAQVVSFISLPLVTTLLSFCGISIVNKQRFYKLGVVNNINNDGRKKNNRRTKRREDFGSFEKESRRIKYNSHHREVRNF